jgi:Heterokaryon incompatibility protein (HET)
LDAAPQYYALSYSWSSRFPESDNAEDEAVDWDGPHLAISCNQLPYYTAQNLYDTLSQIFKDHSENISLWVDAIFISQSDVQEKNNQVSPMGNMFAAAEKVICWLGREDAHIPRAKQLIHLLSAVGPAPVIQTKGETPGCN